MGARKNEKRKERGRVLVVEDRDGTRGRGPLVSPHALDASIFFANNVRVNYPHRYQSDEGGGGVVDGAGRKRPALISRQSEN